MSKGSSSTSGGTTTSTSSLPPWVAQNYQSLENTAIGQSQQPLQQYSGQLVAGFNQPQTDAFNTINNSQGIAAPYINSAADYLNGATAPLWSSTQQYSPTAIQGYQSPYTQQVVDATQAQFNNQNAQQQQQLVGSAIQQHAFGGDRSAIAQSELANQQQLAQAPTISNLYNQSYTNAQQEFNQQQQAQLGANEANSWLASQAGFGMANLGNEAQNTALTGAGAQLSEGNLQQQLSQENLNVPYEEYLQAQGYPYQQINWLGGVESGLGSQGGSSSTSYPGASTLSQLAGLGLTGTALVGQSGGFGSNGWLSSLGSSLGGLFGSSGAGNLASSDVLTVGDTGLLNINTGGVIRGTHRNGGIISAVPHRDTGGPLGLSYYQGNYGAMVPQLDSSAWHSGNSNLSPSDFQGAYGSGHTIASPFTAPAPQTGGDTGTTPPPNTDPGTTDNGNSSGADGGTGVADSGGGFSNDTGTTDTGTSLGGTDSSSGSGGSAASSGGVNNTSTDNDPGGATTLGLGGTTPADEQVASLVGDLLGGTLGGIAGGGIAGGVNAANNASTLGIDGTLGQYGNAIAYGALPGYAISAINALGGGITPGLGGTEADALNNTEDTNPGGTQPGQANSPGGLADAQGQPETVGGVQYGNASNNYGISAVPGAPDVAITDLAGNPVIGQGQQALDNALAGNATVGGVGGQAASASDAMGAAPTGSADAANQGIAAAGGQGSTSGGQASMSSDGQGANSQDAAAQQGATNDAAAVGAANSLGGVDTTGVGQGDQGQATAPSGPSGPTIADVTNAFANGTISGATASWAADAINAGQGGQVANALGWGSMAGGDNDAIASVFGDAWGGGGDNGLGFGGGEGGFGGGGTDGMGGGADGSMGDTGAYRLGGTIQRRADSGPVYDPITADLNQGDFLSRMLDGQPQTATLAPWMLPDTSRMKGIIPDARPSNVPAGAMPNPQGFGTFGGSQWDKSGNQTSGDQTESRSQADRQSAYQRAVLNGNPQLAAQLAKGFKANPAETTITDPSQFVPPKQQPQLAAGQGFDLNNTPTPSMTHTDTAIGDPVLSLGGNGDMSSSSTSSPSQITRPSLGGAPNVKLGPSNMSKLDMSKYQYDPNFQQVDAAKYIDQMQHPQVDPWRPLLAAGLSVLAGRSPQGLVNIGQGGLQGLKEYENEAQQSRQTSEKAFDADSRAKQLMNGIEEFRSQDATKKGEIAMKVAEAQDTQNYRNANLGNEQARTGIEAANSAINQQKADAEGWVVGTDDAGNAKAFNPRLQQSQAIPGGFRPNSVYNTNTRVNEQARALAVNNAAKDPNFTFMTEAQKQSAIARSYNQIVGMQPQQGGQAPAPAAPGLNADLAKQIGLPQ